MEQFLLGLGIGLGLTVMAGPITLTIIESSIEGGRPAGIAAAIGTWVCDLVYIGGTLLSGGVVLNKFSVTAESPWMYITGGLVLIGFGAIFWKVRKKPVDVTHSTEKLKTLAGHFGRGFTINLLSPFSLVFWSTVAITVVLGPHLPVGEAIAFYVGIMLALIFGDSLKAVLASWMRMVLSSRNIIVARSIVAVLFVVLGIVMIGRSFYV